MSEASVVVPYDHLLVIGFGGPERPEDVMPFLRQVTWGHPVPEARLVEVASHYARTGGASPYNAHASRLLDALTIRLRQVGMDLPVFMGMRYWHPLVRDAMRQILRRGLRQGLGIILAPHRSEASFERYIRSVEEASAHEAARKIRYEYLEPWHDHPLFVEAQADRVRRVLDGIDGQERHRTFLLFTAHAIPVDMARRCRYAEEVNTSSRLVAAALGRETWGVAYQSRSGPPHQPWLEPDVREAIRGLAATGTRHVVLVPIGFVFDHTEVLYDLDIEAREAAEHAGLSCRRASTVMDHPRFVTMLAQLVQEGRWAHGNARAQQ